MKVAATTTKRTCQATAIDTDPRLDALNAPKAKGSAISDENRNIHFMKVTTEYFWITGLKMPTYDAKQRLLTTIPRMPQMDVESAPDRMDTQLKIRIRTPMRLRIIPRMPLQVILSLMTMADMTSVMIGLIVHMMDASMAVVLVMAKRKDSCVMNSPRKDATATFQTSFFSICSRGAVNIDQIQNKTVAPKDRRQKSAIGVIFPSSAIFLQLIILKPKIPYATRHARFPTRVLFFSIGRQRYEKAVNEFSLFS